MIRFLYTKKISKLGYGTMFYKNWEPQNTYQARRKTINK